MAKKVFAAGAGLFEGYAPDGTNLVTSNTMTETTVEITSAVEEVRGGKSAGLIGKYFHTSNMAVTGTDALFNLEYLALSCGTKIIEGNVENLASEEIIISTENTITVKGTPVAFGNAGVIGWYKRPNEIDYTLIKFTGKTATVTGLAVNEVICVKYNEVDSSAREIIVPSSVIPSEMHVIIRQDLMAGEQGEVSTYTKVGELVIDIPRFQLNVDQTLNMSMTGASTTSLSGNALKTSMGGGCSGDGYYAKIIEVQYDRKFYEGAFDLAVVGSPLRAGDVISVRALKQNGNTLLLPTQLTYTVSPVGKAVIEPLTGKITSVTAECSVTVKLKDGVNTIPAPYNALSGVALIEMT